MSYFDDVIEPALLRDPPRKRRKQTIITDDISDDKEFMWTTKDGRKYPISLMTDEHLYNAYKLVVKRKFPIGRLNPNLPTYQLVSLMALWERKQKEAQKAFQDEANRRGLGELF